jgi:hypothetical protein
MDLLLDPLGDLGLCQPDGTFITSLDGLRRWLAEMAAAGEAVVVDGLATRVQRPAGWANQKVLYDAKRHTHTAQGVAVSTIWGDLLWMDGVGREAVMSTSSSNCRGWARCWTPPAWPACWTGVPGAGQGAGALHLGLVSAKTYTSGIMRLRTARSVIR